MPSRRDGYREGMGEPRGVSPFDGSPTISSEDINPLYNRLDSGGVGRGRILQEDIFENKSNTPVLKGRGDYQFHANLFGFLKQRSEGGDKEAIKDLTSLELIIGKTNFYKMRYDEINKEMSQSPEVSLIRERVKLMGDWNIAEEKLNDLYSKYKEAFF